MCLHALRLTPTDFSAVAAAATREIINFTIMYHITYDNNVICVKRFHRVRRTMKIKTV